MSSLHDAVCPTCAAAVPLRAPLASEAGCPGCGGRFLVLASEPDDGGRIDVQLLRASAGAGAAPLPGPLRQLGRLFLLGPAALAAAFVLMIVLVATDSGDDGFAFRIIYAAFRLAAVTLVGTVALRLLLSAEDRARPSYDLARSAVVLAIGFASMLVIEALYGSVAPATSDGSLPALAIAVMVPAGLLPGALTATFASHAPYKHAVALGIAVALAPALLVFLFQGGFSTRLGLSLAAYVALTAVLILPCQLAGAWLRLRFRRPTAA